MARRDRKPSLLALKGPKIPAQGNALGISEP